MPTRPISSAAWFAGFDARPTIADSGAAVVLTYLAATSTLDPPGPPFTGPAWLVWLLSAVVAVPVAVRRRWPVPVLAWVVIAGAAATVSGVVGVGVIWTMFIPAALALYTTAAATAPIVSVPAAALSLAAPAVTIPMLYHRDGITVEDAPASEVPLWWQVELGMVAVMLIAVWAIGGVLRWRRAVQGELARRLARDAVSAERLRIARELHDIVGHSLSLIAVKATVANHIAAVRPEESRAALATIEQTSRAALTEIRRLLDVLRADDEPEETRSPVPGPADLADLADRVRSGGLRVDLRLDDVGDLPETLGFTVYRIVQEALTNVVRHARAESCRVTVHSHDSGLRIEIVDDGRGQRTSPRQKPGQGLIGMRERVAVFGGELTAGPRPEGGFRVVAELPRVTAEADR